MNFTQSLVTSLSVLTVVGQIISVLIGILLLSTPRATEKPSLRWLSRHGLSLMLITAVLATAGSLYFSEVAGWTPCKLCWLQRIFMYPQVVLLALAIWKNDRGIAPYILALSVIGLAIAAFHYSEQVMAVLNPVDFDSNVPCDTSGTSCRSTPFFHFGYITIPMMAFTAFLLNILGSLVVIRR